MLRLKITLWTILAPVALLFGPVSAFAMFAPRRRGVCSLDKFGMSGDRLVASLSSHPHRSDAAELIAVADSILLYRIFGKLLFRTRCLKRTLVLYRLLRLRGHDAIAYIGLAPEPHHREQDQHAETGNSACSEITGMVGHAWLTVNGELVEDPIFTPRRRFTPFIEIGESAKQLRGA